MNQDHMTQRQRAARPPTRRRPLRVGDRVSYMFGTHRVVARVVEDHGNIGVGGRQLVAVVRKTYEGELRDSVVAAEDVTLLRDRKRPPSRQG